MIIQRKCGNTVELEYEIRSLKNNELVDLNLYTLLAKLSDGIGGSVSIPLVVTKLTGFDKVGRCLVVVPSSETVKLFPSTYDINVNYVEISTGFAESMQTVHLQLEVE